MPKSAMLQALLERMEGLELVSPTLLRSTHEVRCPCFPLACLTIATCS